MTILKQFETAWLSRTPKNRRNPSTTRSSTPSEQLRYSDLHETRNNCEHPRRSDRHRNRWTCRLKGQISQTHPKNNQRRWKRTPISDSKWHLLASRNGPRTNIREPMNPLSLSIARLATQRSRTSVLCEQYWPPNFSPATTMMGPLGRARRRIVDRWFSGRLHSFRFICVTAEKKGPRLNRGRELA
jgi:hypothetical protein